MRVDSPFESDNRTNAEPMNPAPPVTRSFMSLFVLRFPVVIDARLVVRRAALVGGVVEAVGHVDEHGRLAADHLVSMRDSRRNQDLPRPQRAGVNRVAFAVSRRPFPQ